MGRWRREKDADTGRRCGPGRPARSAAVRLRRGGDDRRAGAAGGAAGAGDRHRGVRGGEGAVGAEHLRRHTGGGRGSARDRRPVGRTRRGSDHSRPGGVRDAGRRARDHAGDRAAGARAAGAGAGARQPAVQHRFPEHAQSARGAGGGACGSGTRARGEERCVRFRRRPGVAPAAHRPGGGAGGGAPSAGRTRARAPTWRAGGASGRATRPDRRQPGTKRAVAGVVDRVMARGACRGAGCASDKHHCEGRRDRQPAPGVGGDGHTADGRHRDSAEDGGASGSGLGCPAPRCHSPVPGRRARRRRRDFNVDVAIGYVEQDAGPPSPASR